MTEKELITFTVQRCTDPSTLSFGAPQTVEAPTALEAAEKVLGQSLSLFGETQDLVGQVLTLKAGQRSVATMIFKAAASAGPAVDSSALQELRSIRDQLARGVADADAGRVPALSSYERAERLRLIATIDADIDRLSSKMFRSKPDPRS